MNLQQLKYLRATVRNHLNLTLAAAQVHTSQPGLSKAIRELEDELGVSIFQRKGKRLVALTPEGEQVMRIVERLLTEADHLKAASQAWRDDEVGELRIATTHTQARYSLPRAIVALRKSFPKIHVLIQQGTPRQIVQMLRDGQADLGLATEALSDDVSLQAEALFHWRHKIIVPPGHALLAMARRPPGKSMQAEGILALEALSDWDIVTYDKEFAGRTRIDQAFHKKGLQPKIVLQATDSDVIKTYVRLGLGVGIVADLALRREEHAAQDEGLIALDFEGGLPLNTTFIAYQRGRILKTSEQTLIQLLKTSG
jgi:LysR family transcriptional regulator, cys regulon transcriptional activator